jgi:META domain-containing protein
VPAGAGITGKAWRLSGIEVSSGNSGSGSGSPDMGVTLTLDGTRYRLTTRCGTNRGSVTITAETIEFGPADVQTGPPCNDETARTAEQVVSRTVRYRLAAGQLTLTKGNTTLDFDR